VDLGERGGCLKLKGLLGLLQLFERHDGVLYDNSGESPQLIDEGKNR